MMHSNWTLRFPRTLREAGIYGQIEDPSKDHSVYWYLLTFAFGFLTGVIVIGDF